MIEDGLDAPWPDGVIAATNQYLQGHLIEKPPFFYAANLDAPVWQLSRAAQEDVPTEERSDAVVELDADQRPLYGIITSQSCDLAEERPDPRQPWFLVAPVYALPPDSPLKDREYIVAIAPPTLPVGCWVADLRVEFPLEKSMLVGRVPIEAFADEAAAIEFAGLLARRRGRPALASVFHEVLNTTMRELKEEDRSAARNVRGKVYKLMLAIEDAHA